MEQKTSLVRALNILDLMGDRKTPVGFMEIQKTLALPKASLSRILNILKEKKFIKQDENTRKYQLGYKILALAGTVLHNLELKEVAGPFMKKLSEITRETVELAIPENGAILYVDKCESPESIRLFAQIGSRYETLHASAPGKVILSFGKEEEIKDFFKKSPLEKITKKTITSIPDLKKQIEKTKKRGWAFDDQEARIGVRRVSAPIFNHERKLMGIIGIAGPSFRITLKKINICGKLIKEAGEKISREFGFKE